MYSNWKLYRQNSSDGFYYRNSAYNGHIADAIAEVIKIVRDDERWAIADERYVNDLSDRQVASIASAYGKGHRVEVSI